MEPGICESALEMPEKYQGARYATPAPFHSHPLTAFEGLADPPLDDGGWLVGSLERTMQPRRSRSGTSTQTAHGGGADAPPPPLWYVTRSTCRGTIYSSFLLSSTAYIFSLACFFIRQKLMFSEKQNMQLDAARWSYCKSLLKLARISGGYSGGTLPGDIPKYTVKSSTHGAGGIFGTPPSGRRQTWNQLELDERPK